jgi:hypothetical protein
VKRVFRQVYEKLLFFAPILLVIAIAAFLVFCTYLANFMITATVVEEEGSGSEAASAGFINTLTFIIPAVVGGFGIALLFKYRKKLTLKYFFGGALFFAGTFITFFFADSILDLIRSQFYSLFILDSGSYNLEILNIQPMINLEYMYLIMIICCGIFGFWMTFIIISTKFNKRTKNYAILFQSALMGAFLSVILPTFTVIILLIALSLYDIYSVRRGPIKDIVKYTMEDEIKHYKQSKSSNSLHPNSSRIDINRTFKKDENIVNKFGNIFSITSKINSPNDEGNIIPTNKSDIASFQNSDESLSHSPDESLRDSQFNGTEHSSKRNTDFTPKIPHIDLQNNFNQPDLSDNSDEMDSMLGSMTYSARDWDVGIGDLVFYSMLASQPLTPYFIFNHGMGLLNTYGLWIFWLISFFTIIGILIGFIITIQLLERNSMLPGLPCSIGLGLTGFIGSTLIISFL